MINLLAMVVVVSAATVVVIQAGAVREAKAGAAASGIAEKVGRKSTVAGQKVIEVRSGGEPL